MAFKSYHHVWLSVHPERSADWLSEKLKEGFDIHHLDGNHGNDHPDNLALIEHRDHMSLHGGRTLSRLIPNISPRRAKKSSRVKFSRVQEKAYREYAATQKRLQSRVADAAAVPSPEGVETRETL